MSRPPHASFSGSSHGLLFLIRSDVRAMVVDRGHGKVIGACAAAFKILIYPRIQAVILYRLSHRLLSLRCAPIAYLLQAIALVVAGAEIHPAAQIGPGFCLVHSSGLVIGHQVVVGENFVCFQGVTLGDSGNRPGQPRLGNRVAVYAGAKILGPVTVGDGARVGANAVVLIEVPAGALAVGVPAQVRLQPKLVQDL